MKSLLRNYAKYSLSLYFLSMILPSITINNGIQTYLVAGIVLTILFFLVKPILNIIGFPVNLITLGLYSTFVNIMLLYLVTVIVPHITITTYNFSGAKLFGFVIPGLHLSTFFTLVFASFLFTLLAGIFQWLMEK